MKERLAVFSGGLSGGMSIISAHNVCHNLCLAAIAVLTVFGISAAGMPLAFLSEYTLLFWSMALAFLALSVFLYSRHKGCVSSKAIVFNSGLIIAGFPFIPSGLELPFWGIGLGIALLAFAWFIQSRFFNKSKLKNCCVNETNK